MVSTQQNATMVALPTSRAFLARPEMATAPSMPTNTQMVTIMVLLTWSRNGMPGEAPVERLARKMSRSNFWKNTMAVMATKMGTNLLMVMTAFTPVASFTPRDTRNVYVHVRTLAPMTDATLLPSPNTGKKYDSAPNKSAEKLTMHRSALIQYPQALLKPRKSPNPAAA